MSTIYYKICKRHGLCAHRMDNTGRYRCKQCAVDAVTLKRQRIKLKAVNFLGGACSICGYKKCINALEFHHVDPSQKEFGIAHNGFCRSWDKLQAELQKCILVCANCHRELHSKQDKQ